MTSNNQVSISERSRVIYLDYLRIAATFGVIVLHISGQNWYTTSVNSFEWNVLNFYDSIVRWVVPIFVMISGALFLDKAKEVSIKKLYSKNILRIITALIFWSSVYALDEGIQGANFSSFFISMLEVNYHLWFLIMLIGLYITVPILRKVTASSQLTKYFLVISFVFTFLIPSISNLLTLLEISSAEKFIEAIQESFSEMNFHLTLGYTSYFVLGYFLSKVDLNRKFRIVIYIFGIIGFITTILLTAGFSSKMQIAYGEFYSNFSLNVLLESISVFVFTRYQLTKITALFKYQTLVLKVSKYSFGIYLVHALIIEIMIVILGINNLSFNPIFSIPTLSIGVFGVSFLISAILNHIPLLNRYIV